MDNWEKHQGKTPAITHMLHRAMHRFAVWSGEDVDKCPFVGFCITCHPRDNPKLSPDE